MSREAGALLVVLFWLAVVLFLLLLWTGLILPASAELWRRPPGLLPMPFPPGFWRGCPPGVFCPGWVGPAPLRSGVRR